MAIVWRRSKAKVNRLLGNRPPETRIAHESAHRFPHEIMEMIIAHLTHDLSALKACSLTCHSWHIATVPHLHHTIFLREKGSGITHDELKTLSKLHKRGLMPFVKEIRVCARYRWYPWFVPRTFNCRNLRYFSAFTNVQTLKVHCMEFYRFIPGIERYFGHFSPTLRSITLWAPRCTPRQLSHFFSLFPNLDDIEIQLMIRTNVPTATIPNTELVPVSAPKLRGQLTLHYFYWTETWTDLVSLCGGLRFRYMDLNCATECVSILLEACAETLETIRFHVPYAPDDSVGVQSLPEFDLSQLRVLRSLQIQYWTTGLGPPVAHRHTAIVEVFSTITSPLFSELVIVLWGYEIAYLPSDVTLFKTLRTINGVRPFELAFMIEGFDLYQEETRKELEGVLDSVTAEGLLDFLESPPNILIGAQTPWLYCNK